MAKLKHISLNAWEYVYRAEVSKDAAASALLILAKQLRNRTVVTYELADWMADAIEASMGKEEKYRAKAFTDELGLTGGGNRRKAVSYLDIGPAVDELIDSGMSETAALEKVAETYEIVRGTARTAYKKWIKAKEIAEKINNQISDLEREK